MFLLAVLLFSGYVVILSDARVIEVYLNNEAYRPFFNASLGLEHIKENLHQCTSTGDLRPSPNRNEPDTMAYTANRRLQGDAIREAREGELQLGVILALGGHSSTHYDYGPAGSLNGLMAIWDSWKDNFFSQTSNTSSLVLLLDHRDFRNQNVTRNIEEYIDILLVKNMGAKAVSCAVLSEKKIGFSFLKDSVEGSLRNVPGSVPGSVPVIPKGCNNKVAGLDQGYQIYYIDVATPSNPHQKPLIIFAGVHKFAPPEWANGQDEEHLYLHWKPFKLNRRFPTNYGYVKMTNWYAYHMLNLQLLDYFDYASKLDNDVSFVAPFPAPNLPLKLAEKGLKMMGTQNTWYTDDWRVVQGIKSCITGYIDVESIRCQKLASKNMKTPQTPQNSLTNTPTNTANNNNNINKNDNTNNKSSLTSGKGNSENNGNSDSSKLWLKPNGINSSIFWEGNLNVTFRAHFLVFWLGLYAAPEVKGMSKYWNDYHPRGMWDYRWGDQQWWPRPMSVFGTGDLKRDLYQYEDLNTDNESSPVVHKLWPRYGTIAKNNYFNDTGSTVAMRDAIYNISGPKQYKYRPF